MCVIISLICTPFKIFSITYPILYIRSEPTIKVLLEDNSDNLGSIVFKTANLKVEDVLTKFNEMVLPHVKVELEEDRTTKGAKKGGAASKKKKGGK